MAETIGGERPKRIQRKRSKGWKMPPNTVYVGRPGPFGNLWKIGVRSHLIGGVITTRAEAVRCYRELGNNTEDRKAFVRERLRGKNLACWCPLDQPCHADVLLEIANA